MLILVINLKQDTSKMARIGAALDKLGLKYERIEAVYGKAINREEHPEIYKGDSCIVRHNFLSKAILKGRLTDGELGCAMSHLKAYNHVLNSGKSGALILEDDFIPDCNLMSVFQKAIQEKPDADIISGAGYTNNGVRNAFWYSWSDLPGTDRQIKRLGIPGLNWFFNRRRRQCPACCYYISARACERLLFLAYPVRFEADVLTGMLAMNGFHYYLMQPELGHIEGESSIYSLGGGHGGTRFI